MEFNEGSVARLLRARRRLFRAQCLARRANIFHARRVRDFPVRVSETWTKGQRTRKATGTFGTAARGVTKGSTKEGEMIVVQRNHLSRKVSKQTTPQTDRSIRVVEGAMMERCNAHCPPVVIATFICKFRRPIWYYIPSDVIRRSAMNVR